MTEYSYHVLMKATNDIKGGSEDSRETPTAWLRSWLDAADEVMGRAPAGRSAREEFEADRNRLSCYDPPSG